MTPTESQLKVLLVQLAAALTSKRLIQLHYHGSRRVVQPYILGFTSAGRAVLSGYQMKGDSSSGPSPAWRNFYLTGISDFVLLDAHFSPRKDYNPDDANFPKIVARVSTSRPTQ